MSGCVSGTEPGIALFHVPIPVHWDSFQSVLMPVTCRLHSEPGKTPGYMYIDILQHKIEWQLLALSKKTKKTGLSLDQFRAMMYHSFS